MKVLAWVPQGLDTTPGQRFRIEQWAPHLAERGIEVIFSPFADPELARLLAHPGHFGAKAAGILRASGRRLAEAVRATRADVVYVFREGALFGPAVAERVLGLRGIPFVFDFDDAVWVRYVSPSNGLLSYLRFPGKTATLCRRAQHVMAGNEYLRDYALQHNSHVSVVPTTIDTQVYQPRKPPFSGVPVIGWSGSFSTVQYLDLVRPALEELARHRQFRLKVLGGSGVRMKGVDVECIPWRPDNEVEVIATFDIGLMPLPDDKWARGKCGLKALQYMALAVPAVVSPVGVNTVIVTHERTGLLATTSEDWTEQLDRLLGDESLRGRLGKQGRHLVEERYSARVVAPSVARIFEGAMR